MGAHGTWKQTGGVGDAAKVIIGIAAAAILIGSGTLTAAVTAVTDLLTIVLLSLVAAVLILAAAAVFVWRKYGRGSSSVPEQLLAFHQARQVPAPKRPAVAPAQHLHIHVASPDAAAEVVRQIKQGEAL